MNGYSTQRFNALSLQQNYLHLVQRGEIEFNPTQSQILAQCQPLLDQLNTSGSWLERFGFVRAPSKGIYLWGGVGAGKTMMMDMFFHALNISRKKRLHFHEFMRSCHQSLAEYAGSSDPLKKIVKKLNKSTTVLCLDEFFVADIGDAMILSQLLKNFGRYGITLVITSNTEPKHLYAEGLQRAKFLPAIDWIEKNLLVLPCQIEQDYRFNALKPAGLYHHPVNQKTQHTLEVLFKKLHPGAEVTQEPIEIAHRMIPVVSRTETVIWFEFSALCQTARSQIDYLDIAKRYPVIILSGIPHLDRLRADERKRLIYLVDVLYEAHVDLVIQAEEPLSAWEVFSQQFPECARTYSRLQEMQTERYLSRDHVHTPK
jgi:cell division protein ZapE